ncbi:hypothetical protein AA15237_2196 [Komagataeibacter xylinus NBRC 15237]|nr:hypothetical protein AA15237_2196 [Komagataeibacter xylinus NBRC 15237]
MRQRQSTDLYLFRKTINKYLELDIHNEDSAEWRVRVYRFRRGKTPHSQNRT